MTWRDKREIGLREDTSYRKYNLPEGRIRDPMLPTRLDRAPEVPMAPADENYVQLTIAFDDELEPHGD